MRAPGWWHLGHWQKKDLIPKDYEFIAKVMSKWDEGHDTAQIALELFQPESAVERALHHGREKRRQEEANEGR